MRSHDLRMPGSVLVAGLLLAAVAPATATAPAPATAQAQAQVLLTAADAAPADNFGDAVAVSGNRVLVGASLANLGTNTDAGAAYVYVRSGHGWVAEAKLTAPDAGVFDLFGIDVALSGDTAVVGAPSEIHAGLAQVGCAYVFVRNGPAWPLQAKLTTSDEGVADYLGTAVAVSGDTIALGKPSDTHGLLFGAGSVYVYERSGTTWTETAKLIPSDPALGAAFGCSVALSGDTLVVGAQYDPESGAAAGSAYVFVRNGTSWTEQAKLNSSDASPDDIFGRSVAVSGDTVVVGAFAEDPASTHDAGAAWVFVRNGATWSQQARLVAQDAALNDKFGVDVAVSGDTAVVGAPHNDQQQGVVLDSGTAYVFVRRGTLWHRQDPLWPHDPATADQFGGSVAIAGTTVVAGRRNDDTAAGIDAGSASLFEVSQP